MAAKSGEDVRRDGGDFECNENQNEFDGRRHQAHADYAEENQAVVLSGADFLDRHVFVRSKDDGGRDGNDEDVKEDTEAIHAHHVRKGSPVAA